MTTVEKLDTINFESNLASLPKSLQIAIQLIYLPAGLQLSSFPTREKESSDYGACRLSLLGKNIVYRDAKTTPNKMGQFVTIWKRPFPGAEITPFDENDEIDFIVIGVADETHRGQFIFNREVLIRKGLISQDGKGGKLSFRIYPPWSKPIVKSAIQTKNWQLDYFFEIQPNSSDSALIQKLFAANI